MKYLFFLFVINSFVFTVYSQDATEALSKIIEKYNTVDDYKVNVKVVADVPMIKILPSKATIYFKQKNKFKIVSKGIVLLPKQGFSDLFEFLAKPSNYMAVFGSYETINQIKTRIVNVIPNAASNEIILAKLWIDEKSNLIIKAQLTTKGNGTLLTYYEYTDVKYGLPSKMTVEIEVKKFKLPKSVASDINNTKKTKEKQKKKGTIIIYLTDYTVNSGLDDKLFTK
ncbi:MAG: hypothetical protein KA521_08525 [Crocinitomicaceae bacterium]|nr:hypothetical protein [Crocinitomicaceae bacterium]